MITLQDSQIIDLLFERSEQAITELSEKYEKHSRELNKVYHYIKKKKKKNDFEQQFVLRFKELAGNLEEIVTKMKYLEERGMDYVLCHGDYNQHNILVNEEEFRITNFENVEYNIPLIDMAQFMRKILEKHQWSLELGREMIRCYQKERFLSDAERQNLV